MVNSSKLLVARRITKVFPNGKKDKWVLRDIDFDMEPFDSLAIVGPSGCGKTTLLLILTGLIPASEGVIRLDGEPLGRTVGKIALVLQDYGLFPWKTVHENIILGAQLRKTDVFHQKVEEIKRELGIAGLDDAYPRQLSGGERQRVALARALLLKPELLLLDEPFAAIDAITREHLQNHLITIFERRSFSFIIVTHSIEEAVFLGRRIKVMDGKGRGFVHTISNPEAGNEDYRKTHLFFQRCSELRQILREGL